MSIFRMRESCARRKRSLPSERFRIFSGEPGLHVIDLTDAYATPGFIDSHIHGGGGYDTAKALEPDADINILCRHLATHGITTFLPTLMSYPRDKMIALTAKLAELVEDSYEGADPCAINLEGPFINVRKCGSQNPEAICSIDMGYARELSRPETAESSCLHLRRN